MPSREGLRTSATRSPLQIAPPPVRKSGHSRRPLQAEMTAFVTPDQYRYSSEMTGQALILRAQTIPLFS